LRGRVRKWDKNSFFYYIRNNVEQCSGTCVRPNEDFVEVIGKLEGISGKIFVTVTNPNKIESTRLEVAIKAPSKHHKNFFF